MDRELDALAPEPGAFDAAERHGVHAVVGALVDHHAAALELLAGAQRRLDVVGEDCRVQPVVDLVRPPDRLLQAVEAIENGNGTVDFLRRQLTIVG